MGNTAISSLRRSTVAIALSSFSGTTLGFSFDGTRPDWLFAVLCVATLAWCLFSTRTYAEALFSGWWAGIVGWALACYWIPGSLRAFTGAGLGWGIAVLAGLSIVQGFTIGAFAVLTHLLRRSGAPSLVAVPTALVATEYAIPTPFAHYLGLSLHGESLALQLASLGGPLLLTALIAVTGACLAEVLRSVASKAPPYVPAAVLGSVWTASVLFGAVHLDLVETRGQSSQTITVGVVQENVDPSEKHLNPDEDIRRYLLRSQELVSAHDNIELLVWPETVVAYRFDRSIKELDELVFPKRPPTYLLFGGYRRIGEDVAISAFLVNKKGDVVGAYNKQELFPLSENVPRLDLISELAASAGGSTSYTSGGGDAVLQVGPLKIGSLICYDEMFPGLTRTAVLQDANLLVSLSNDAWFGDSHVRAQHLALAKVRAAETQRVVVRSTNTGTTAIVGADGRVSQRAPNDAAAELVANVPLLTDKTPYVRWGDWPGVLALMVALLAIVWCRVRERRSAS